MHNPRHDYAKIISKLEGPFEKWQLAHLEPDGLILNRFIKKKLLEKPTPSGHPQLDFGKMRKGILRPRDPTAFSLNAEKACWKGEGRV